MMKVCSGLRSLCLIALAVFAMGFGCVRNADANGLPPCFVNSSVYWSAFSDTSTTEVFNCVFAFTDIGGGGGSGGSGDYMTATYSYSIAQVTLTFMSRNGGPGFTPAQIGPVYSQSLSGSGGSTYNWTTNPTNWSTSLLTLTATCPGGYTWYQWACGIGDAYPYNGFDYCIIQFTGAASQSLVGSFWTIGTQSYTWPNSAVVGTWQFGH